MTEKRRVPTRAELLGLNKTKVAVKEKKVREKNTSEKFSSLNRRLEQLEKRRTKASSVLGKIEDKISDTKDSLKSICPHKVTFLAYSGRPEELPDDIKPIYYRWCNLCGTMLGRADM